MTDKSKPPKMVADVARTLSTHAYLSPDGWEDFTEEARLVIETMRVPTNNMLEAGFRAMANAKWDASQADMMGAAWDAMIAEALK